MTSAQDKTRVSALMTGLSAVAGSWIFVAAFAPTKLEALGGFSPWFDGPVLTAAWALFSGLAYLLLRRGDIARHAPDEIANYRCRMAETTPYSASASVCASREEKRRLAAATAGFALTISVWVATLSFLPEGWFNALNAAPVWFYCLVSVGLWGLLTAAMRVALEASEHKPRPLT
jgi:hypothetical protein